MRPCLPLLAFLLLAACGKKDAEKARPSPATTSAAPGPEAPPPAPGAPPSPPPADPRLEEWRQKEKELLAARKEAEEALEALLARHREERAALGDLDPIRKKYRDVKIEWNKKHGEAAYFEAELKKLQGVEETGLHPKLVALRKERDKLDQELDRAITARREEQARVGAGGVEEASVAKEIRAVRSVVEGWLEQSHVARARPLKPEEKRELNAKFVAWLKAQPERASVVQQVLAQPLAGGRGKLEAYDYSSLDFFVLCKNLEHDLDRKNIAVQKKEGAEFAQRIEDLEARKTKIEAELQQIAEEAGEVARYDTMLKKMQQARAIEDQLGKQLAALLETLAPDRETEERHQREAAGAEAAIQRISEDLARLRAAMRKAG